jgi:hypothetical protein
MGSDSSNMTCLVFSDSFGSSDNFSVVVSLNDLQSNGSTSLQLNVAVASKPPSPSAQPEDHIDWQEVTTIGVAAGIVVSRGLCADMSLFMLLLNAPQVLCVVIGCCYFIARRRRDRKVATQHITRLPQLITPHIHRFCRVCSLLSLTTVVLKREHRSPFQRVISS